MRRKTRKFKRITPPKLDAKAIGHRVHVLRVQRGWLQTEVSAMIGVRGGVISAIESGQRLPSRDVLFALSHVFKVRLDYILLGRGARKKSWYSNDAGTDQACPMTGSATPVSVRNLG